MTDTKLDEAALLKDVARAICRVQLNGGDPDQPAVRWNGTECEPQEFPAWRDFLDEARAAIAAWNRRAHDRLKEDGRMDVCVETVSERKDESA